MALLQGVGPGFDHPPHRFFHLGSTDGMTRTLLLLGNVNVSCSLSYDHLGPSRHGMDRGTGLSWVTEREG